MQINIQYYPHIEINILFTNNDAYVLVTRLTDWLQHWYEQSLNEK